MRIQKVLKILPLCARHNAFKVQQANMHTSSATLHKYNAVQIHNLSVKYLGADSKLKKDKTFEEEKRKVFKLEVGSALMFPRSTSGKDTLNKRDFVLRKRLLMNLVEVFRSSHIAPVFRGYGLNIEQIRLPQSVYLLQVFWSCGHEDHRETLQQLIQRYLGVIHRELTATHNMGRVPPIEFYHMDYYNRLKTSVKHLPELNYGTDFKPSLTGKVENIEAICDNMSPEAWDEVSNSLIEQHADTEEKCPPILRNDIYGIDRKRILSQITIIRAKKSTLEEFPMLEDLYDDRDGRVASSRRDIRKWALRFRYAKQKSMNAKNKRYIIERMGNFLENDDVNFQFEEFLPDFKEDFEDEL